MGMNFGMATIVSFSGRGSGKNISVKVCDHIYRAKLSEISNKTNDILSIGQKCYAILENDKLIGLSDKAITASKPIAKVKCVDKPSRAVDLEFKEKKLDLFMEKIPEDAYAIICSEGRLALAIDSSSLPHLLKTPFENQYSDFAIILKSKSGAKKTYGNTKE